MLVLSIVFTGCGKQDGKKDSNDKNASNNKKIMRVNNTEEPGSLHPGKAQGTHDSWVLEHIFEGLTKKDANGNIVAGMAKEWKVSEDGLTYTFTLRDGVKWTNGDPVTAGDFEYAWKYALNPNTASDYAYILYPITGAEAYNTADPSKISAEKLKELENAVGVKAINDKTLEVKLTAPTAYFTEMLSFYTYYPVNKKVQEANPNWYTNAETYVSNGAFKMTEWKHKESITVVKNEDYYDKAKIKLDGINFAMINSDITTWQMYENGELDLGFPLPQDVVAQLKSKNDPQLTIGNDLSTYFYRFNTTVKPLNNAKVRKALSMAINRSIITEQVTQGGQRPAFSFTPPGIPDAEGKDFQATNGHLFEVNIEEAKKLLAEGLAEEGMNKLTLTIIYNTDEGHKRIAEAVQSMWKENLGVEVKLENMEFQVKIDREHALDYQVSRAGWIGDYIDPMTFLDMFLSDSSMNDTGWKNAQYDALIKDAQTTTDVVKRMNDLYAAEKILMEEMPIMPIYFYTQPYATKSNVTGIYKPVNRYPQLHYADIIE